MEHTIVMMRPFSFSRIRSARRVRRGKGGEEKLLRTIKGGGKKALINCDSTARIFRPRLFGQYGLGFRTVKEKIRAHLSCLDYPVIVRKPFSHVERGESKCNRIGKKKRKKQQRPRISVRDVKSSWAGILRRCRGKKSTLERRIDTMDRKPQGRVNRRGWALISISRWDKARHVNSGKSYLEEL